MIAGRTWVAKFWLVMLDAGIYTSLRVLKALAGINYGAAHVFCSQGDRCRQVIPGSPRTSQPVAQSARFSLVSCVTLAHSHSLFLVPSPSLSPSLFRPPVLVSFLLAPFFCLWYCIARADPEGWIGIFKALFLWSTACLGHQVCFAQALTLPERRSVRIIVSFSTSLSLQRCVFL